MPRLLHALALATLTLAAAGAHAQAKPDGLWHGGISIGGANASGNTSSRSLALSGDTARATADDKISLYGLANYGQSEVSGRKSTTANLLRLGGRYDFNLSADVFAFGGAEAETHKVAGIDDRYNLNAGVGYKLIRTDVTSFDLFAGAGYGDTRFTNGASRSGATALLGEESSHKLSDTTSVKQRLVLYPGSGEVGSRATFDAGLSTSIAGGWTLNTGFAARYASKVPAGSKTTDTLLTFGFGYKF